MSYGSEALARDLGLTRAACDRLEAHRALLALWSPRINLIGPNELEHYWRRHALDCGQLAAHAPDARRWIDLGSGAGFPGLVVACLLEGEARVDLVEPSAKRAAFLREAVRATGAPARVLEMTAEQAVARAERYDVVTARAFAPLPRIIDSANPVLESGAIGLFPKGADWRLELQASADEGWRLAVQALPSLSDPEGRILRIEGAARVRTSP